MNKIKLPSNELILYALALAGALTFAYAFLVMDGASLLSVSGILLVLRGIVLGVAAGLGMAKISHALPRANKTNAPYLRGAFVVFMIVTPLIISPVTYATMSPAMRALDQWVRIAVSIASGVFVDTLTAGVAFASGKLEADDKPASSDGEAKPKPVKAESKPEFICSCGYVAKSQAALSGHQGKHKRKEAKVSGYKVSFEPVIGNGKVGDK